MPTFPRRLRFGLRTLFAVVTVVALLSAFFAWYIQRPPFPIVGDISRADVAAILEVIEGDPKVPDKRVMLMRVIDPDEVEVQTGYSVGEVSGAGVDVKLNKKNGVWVIVGYDIWIS